MELLFQDKKVQIGQNIDVNIILEKINELLNETFYLSYLIVDGIEVYEEPEFYLNEHIDEIKVIEIVGLKSKELTNEILLSTEKYIENAERHLIELAEGFYNNPNAECWNNFNEMLEGIQWLSQVINVIDKLREKPINWDTFIQLASSLQVELKNMEDAVVAKDYVLIADIVQYEILPIYLSIRKQVEKTIDTEGIRYDVN